MTELERAVEALKAAAKQSGVSKHLPDVVSQFASYLVILNSTCPSPQSISNLHSVLRRDPVPLYVAFPGPALRLSSAIFRKIFVCNLRNAANFQVTTCWNEIAVALLSGVLDFLDKHSDDVTKEIVASAFYPIICTFFFDQDDSLTLSPRTQVAAYSLLHETLSGHPGNQRRLRDHTFLGGSLIGITISQSRDYLVIEALLYVVGWLIPMSTAKRTEFINDLFGSDKIFTCSSELVNILQCITSSCWESTVMKIMDALAYSDITFPQSFALDEVYICGKCYPQPTAFDRLHLDRAFFLVNLVGQDDVCQSLKISYDHVRSVLIDVSKAPPLSKFIVYVDLTMPPSIGDVSLAIPEGQKLYLKFEIQRENLNRLVETLNRRGIVKLNFLGENPQKQATKWTRVCLAHGIRLSSEPLPPSSQGSQFEDKANYLGNAYETDFPGNAQSIAAHSEQTSLPLQQAPRQAPASKPEFQVLKSDASAKCAQNTVLRPDLANMPVKLAGTRRKWDDANSPTIASKLLGDDHPPEKRAHGTTSSDILIEYAASILTDPSDSSMLSPTVAKASRKYVMRGGALSPILPENARVKAIGASKPAPKEVPAPISGIQIHAAHEFESPKDIVSKLLLLEADTGMVAAPEPVDQITKVLHDAANGPSASSKSDSASRKQANKTAMNQADPSTTETHTRSTHAVITETEISTPGHARTDPVFIAQHASTNEVKPSMVCLPDEDPLSPIQDIASGDVEKALFGDFIDFSVSLKESEDDAILPASPLLTPRKLPVCTDPTLDPTPVENCHGSGKNRGVANDARMLQSKDPHPVESFKTSTAIPVALHITECQDGHRSCIGVSRPSIYAAMDVIRSQDSSPLSKTLSHNEQRELASLNISLTPVRANDGEGPLTDIISFASNDELESSQPAQKSPRENSRWNMKSDEDGDIQDIVDVLNDIQTFIVEGIANKLKGIKEDARVVRKELLRDAAQALHALADAYATQYNSFIPLVDSYSKHSATMARRWEDLIKSSEQLQDDLRKALQEHDRNVSSKTFPKSLFPPTSRFLRH